MSSLNRINLFGRLGSDVELRYTQSQKAVANFSLATSITANGKETTEWHKIQVWEKQAEACKKYLSKGKQVYVEGRMTYRPWEKDGVKQISAEVVASKIIFTSPSQDTQQQTTPAPVEEFNLDVF